MNYSAVAVCLVTLTFYVKLNVIVRPNAGPCKILTMHQDSGLNDAIATKARRMLHVIDSTTIGADGVCVHLQNSCTSAARLL